ncbi:hypothetical protein jhhlp_008789 [Lomentospora prolificans]|uniref:Uncharacterized protein n=1 Tax=Lomentospora prolificans TaxID=41688 RepID=A0A2N3MZ10_9PEZI|nr:hypothetical protein jhhlp_008789 [Lomentospora prolificans]
MAAITGFPLETGAFRNGRQHATTPFVDTDTDAPTPTQHAVVPRSWADPSNCVDDYSDTSSHCASLQTAVNSCVGVLDNGQVNLDDDRFVNCFCVPDIYTGLVE